MRNTFIATLEELAAENRNIWLLCGDLGYSVLEPFARRFPDRYLNIGVAEQNMAGVAAGIALSGKTVFIYSIGNFPTLRCLEQLRNDVCYHGADVKVVAVGAGFAYGSQGYTHHAVEDVAIMSMLPGMEVLAPCDPMEVRLATRAMAVSGKPTYLRLSRAGEPILHKSEPSNLDRPILIRQGSDGCVLAAGPIATACLAAADALRADGVEVAVYSVPRLKPLDDAFMRDLARRSRFIVTVEEHVLRGGLHAAVSSAIADNADRPRVAGLGIPELAGKTSVAGDREGLLGMAGLSPASIAQRIRALAKLG